MTENRTKVKKVDNVNIITIMLTLSRLKIRPQDRKPPLVALRHAGHTQVLSKTCWGRGPWELGSDSYPSQYVRDFGQQNIPD